MLILRPEAQADLQTGYDWYEKQQPGLGDSFLDEMDKVVASLDRLPDQHPIVYQSVRRALLKRFPYAVFYIHDAPKITVLAVMHQSQNPSRWQERA